MESPQVGNPSRPWPISLISILAIIFTVLGVSTLLLPFPFVSQIFGSGTPLAIVASAIGGIATIISMIGYRKMQRWGVYLAILQPLVGIVFGIFFKVFSSPVAGAGFIFPIIVAIIGLIYLRRMQPLADFKKEPLFILGTLCIIVSGILNTVVFVRYPPNTQVFNSLPTIPALSQSDLANVKDLATTSTPVQKKTQPISISSIPAACQQKTGTARLVTTYEPIPGSDKKNLMSVTSIAEAPVPANGNAVTFSVVTKGGMVVSVIDTTRDFGWLALWPGWFCGGTVHSVGPLSTALEIVWILTLAPPPGATFKGQPFTVAREAKELDALSKLPEIQALANQLQISAPQASPLDDPAIKTATQAAVHAASAQMSAGF